MPSYYPRNTYLCEKQKSERKKEEYHDTEYIILHI
jgi:hypothetical protein